MKKPIDQQIEKLKKEIDNHFKYVDETDPDFWEKHLKNHENVNRLRELYEVKDANLRQKMNNFVWPK